jgi:hypothetical protein
MSDWHAISNMTLCASRAGSGRRTLSLSASIDTPNSIVAKRVRGSAQRHGSSAGGISGIHATFARHTRTSRSFASAASTKSVLCGALIVTRTNSPRSHGNWRGK